MTAVVMGKGIIAFLKKGLFIAFPNHFLRWRRKFTGFGAYLDFFQ